MNQKVKKIVAREWLFFLVFLILGPPIGGSLWASYEWARAARLLLPDKPLEEMGALQIVLKYGELVNKHLYYRLSQEETETELRKIAEELARAFPNTIEVPAKPQRREKSDFIESLLQERAIEKAKEGIEEDEKGPLIYKKHSLPAYVYNRVLDPIDWGLYLILTFPAYLAFMFLRSVVWSVRTLRRKEVNPSN